MVTDINGIIAETAKSGGCTCKIVASVQANTHGRIMLTVNPHKTGFYVALTVNSQITQELTPKFLGEFIRDNFDALSNGTLLGIWKDGADYYVELTRHVPGRIEAIAEGYDRKQLAIFDVANSCEIRLNPSNPAKLPVASSAVA